MTDSPEYQQRKRFFDSLLTVYGRKPVLEALQSKDIKLYRLHLADSNRGGGTMDEILKLAERQNVEVVYHNRKELARISRNGKQDQGVAADLQLTNYKHYEDFLTEHADIPYPNNSAANRPLRLLALCGIQNPQNLGMIIRSACAGDIDGILIPKKGCASLSPLVIKASTGTLFKAPILSCAGLKAALQTFKSAGFSICALSSHAKESLFEHKPDGSIVYVLGNETEGVSTDVFELADKKLMIPMSNDVESLNVAVTAALIAFSNNL